MPKKTQFSLVFFFLFRMDQFNKLHWFEMLKIRYKSQRSSCHELGHTQLLQSSEMIVEILCEILSINLDHHISLSPFI
jgi:hypothetical protein